MDRAQIRAKAREQLGGGIFSGNWIMAIVVALVASIAISAGSIVVVGSIILLGPIAYGMSAMFLKQARDGEKMEIGDLFKGFTEDFLQTFLLGFLGNLMLGLWNLIPIVGIVKTYAYSMMYFVKADHPEYSWNECITESRQIMNGHKMDLFLLHLSFIGWAILGELACGVGLLWVSAYIEAATAQFYLEITGQN